MAAVENRLQSDIIRFLKGKGAYVVKTRPGMGTPVGCPDVIALFEGAWLVIECKASAKAKFQPGQEMTLMRLKQWCPFVYIVYPENWPEIKAELTTYFF